MERAGSNQAISAGKKIRNMQQKTLDLFQAYDWSGNIRELRNGVERAVILSDGETFSVDGTWLKRETDEPSEPLFCLPVRSPNMVKH